MKFTRTFLLLPLLALAAGQSEDFGARCADRAALERVYYRHRLGEKPPFEQVLPPATLKNLVRRDLRKEAALKQAYGVEVTPALLNAEVQRINTTTRAPDILAEIKTALGHDPARFAEVFAKPILVERLLRERFDNDDALHAPQRRTVELVRRQLLAARSRRGNEAQTDESAMRNPKSAMDQCLLTSAATNDRFAKPLALLQQLHSNDVSETTWQLGARPAEASASAADEVAIKQRFGPNAQMLSSPHADGNRAKSYFEDLPAELQNVLRVQLRQPGDVSAVIEMPGVFLLYVAKEKTDAVLSVAALSLPKRSYEQWLEEQSKKKP